MPPVVWPSPPPPPPPAPPRPIVIPQAVAAFSLGSYTYSVYSQAATFTQAEAYCTSKGGNLASILSADEQAAVSQQLSTLVANGTLGGGVADLWMGLHLQASAGRYWTDGYGLSYLPQLFTGIDVYAEGGCYGLNCRLGGTCVWSLAMPFQDGCVSVAKPGFICKTDSNRIKAAATLSTTGTTYLLLRPASRVAFNQADAACFSVGGRLVTVHNVEENNLIMNMIYNSTVVFPSFPLTDRDASSGNLQIWLGLFFQTSLYDSFWPDGTLASQGFYAPVNTSYPFACVTITCGPVFCNWQSQWCGQLLPAVVCEIRSLWG